MNAGEMRKRFFAGFWSDLRLVWPILSALIVLMIGLGIVVGVVERWPLGDSLYFAFVSGLTIGYGDLVPKTMLARVLAIAIGLTGILLTGLIAAVGVRALMAAHGKVIDR